MELTNVLGETLLVLKFYEDGSFNCPFCSYAVIAPATLCSNPWCSANPTMPVAAAQKIVDDAAKRKAEEERRKSLHTWSMQRIAEDRQAKAQFRADTIAEAKNRGTCVRCCLDNYDRVKFVKHRGTCPKER